MTATLNQSTAILKRKYPNGVLPKAMYADFPFIASMTHKEDFDGENKVIALQIERGQASSASAPTAIAQSATTQGNYQRFLITRNNHYGVARIAGDALEAAKNNTGALVDLWNNETDQASAGELQCLEQYLFGTGNGVLGTISSGSTVGSSTITLSDVVNSASAAISKFALGMTVVAVSDTTLSPTLRSGNAVITGINRTAGTLTVAGNWSDPGNIPGIVAGDSLCRLGDNASSGSNNVIVGTKAYIAGGSSPSALFGLTRTTDSVRLAGQRLNAAGQPMEDMLIQAWALRAQQFRQKGKMVAWCNTLDMGQFLKSIGGKVEYTRVNVDSKVAAISFEGIDLMTSQGVIRLMDSPFIERGDLHMLYMDSFAVESLGPAPHLLNHDGPNFLRVATDDAYEVRFGSRAQLSCNNPAGSIIITSWGL